MSRWRIDPAHVVDVFVYVVVLNLAVELTPSVLSESFTISLLTAVLLKLVLELVVAGKNRALGRFKDADSWRPRVTSALMLILLGPGPQPGAPRPAAGTEAR